MARVKCAICGEQFDYTKTQAVRHGARRYSHYTCEPTGVLVPLPEKKEKTDEDRLLEYITALYGKENINYGAVKKSLKDFKEKYGYTDSGMLKSLHYWYEVKHNDPKKANGSIGIIPYIYATARAYYYNIWQANQKNADVEVENYVPRIKEITIQSPRVEVKKRNLFSFLDEEQEEK